MVGRILLGHLLLVRSGLTPLHPEMLFRIKGAHRNCHRTDLHGHTWISGAPNYVQLQNAPAPSAARYWGRRSTSADRLDYKSPPPLLDPAAGRESALVLTAMNHSVRPAAVEVHRVRGHVAAFHAFSLKIHHAR